MMSHNYRKILEDIKNCSSKKDKLRILKAAGNEDEIILRQIFLWTYNPFVTYGVKKFDITEIKPGEEPLSLAEKIADIDNLLSRLAERSITGFAAKYAVEDMRASLEEEDKDIFSSIISRDLLIGLNSKGYNSVFPGTIPVYECALGFDIGDRLEKISKEFDGNTWSCSRKLDGLRCQMFFSPKEVNKALEDAEKASKSKEAIFKEISSLCKFRTREGQEFKTLTKLVEIAIQGSSFLEKNFPDNDRMVLDGECCVIDKDGKEDFTKILSLYNRLNYTIENPTLMAFDLLTEDEFFVRKVSRPFFERYETLVQFSGIFNTPLLKLVEQTKISSVEDLEYWRSEAKRLGWEGLMLRKNVVFAPGHTFDMLKLKDFLDAEFVVKGVETGIKSYAVKGEGQKSVEAVTHLFIEYKTSEVKVGSGITKEQGEDWFRDPSEILGKTITVKYFREIQDKNGKYSLRFPSLKCVHGEKRET
jgi:hypothetical protein